MADTHNRIDKVIEALAESGRQISALAENIKSNQKSTKDQEDRIRVLEGWHQRLMPILAIGAAIIGAMIRSLFE